MQRMQDAQLGRQLGNLHPADIAYVLESLSMDNRLRVWKLINEKKRGAVLLELSEQVRLSLPGNFTDLEILETARYMSPSFTSSSRNVRMVETPLILGK